MFEPVNKNTTNTVVTEMCTFIAGDKRSDVFQVWAESEANTMRKLVLMEICIVDILPSMSTCLNLNQHRVNTHLLIIHITCGHAFIHLEFIGAFHDTQGWLLSLPTTSI